MLLGVIVDPPVELPIRGREFKQSEFELLYYWLPWTIMTQSAFYNESKKDSNVFKKIFIRNEQSALIDNIDKNVFAKTPQIQAIKKTLSGYQYYDFLKNVLRNDQKHAPSENFKSDGTNFPSVLKALKEEKPDQWNNLFETIQSINPHIDDIQVKVYEEINKSFLSIKEDGLNKNIESWYSSDGTLRSIAILLALETCDEFSTIIIEEPENGIHPWAIRSLMEHIQDVVKRRNIQVIISTHSEHVLSSAKPDQVRVVEKTMAEGTKIYNLQDIAPHNSIEKGDIGRLWVKGLLKGVPNLE